MRENVHVDSLLLIQLDSLKAEQHFVGKSLPLSHPIGYFESTPKWPISLCPNHFSQTTSFALASKLGTCYSLCGMLHGR